MARLDRLPRARQAVLTLLTVQVGVLAVTGIALYFLYRPSGAAAWNDIRSPTPGVRVSHWLHHAHRAVATTVGPTILAAAILVAAERSGWRWRRQWLVTGGLTFTALAALLSGPRLPWDQLALWAVTAGLNLTGYEPLREAHARWVLIGGAEVAPSVVLRWLAFHVITGGPVMAVLVAAAWRLARRGGSSSAQPTSPGGTG